ncbi:MAG: hypothetical protein L0154_00645 [Chloroflexi bacterium]|nr:hypothetical protein [Chloroflexota bacterium]
MRGGLHLGSALATALAIVTAALVIVGLLSAESTEVAAGSDIVLQIVSITIALAVLVGIWNLISVHVGRLIRTRKGWIYSLITLLSAVAVTAVYVMDETASWTGELEGEKLSPRVFEAVQVSIESALAGLIVFFLTYAIYRLLYKRFTWTSILFMVAVAIVLLGWLPLEDDSLVDLREWLMTVPVLAGSRGLLIGIGLGTVIVGIRALTGYDRALREP